MVKGGTKMKYIAEWILKIILTGVFIVPIMVLSVLLSLLMWDDSYAEHSVNIFELLWFGEE